MKFFESVFIVAFIAAFLITLAKKWGFVEHVQVRGSEFFSDMFHCDFCLSFWASVIVSFVFFICTGDASFFVVPFCSTMIARFLL